MKNIFKSKKVLLQVMLMCFLITIIGCDFKKKEAFSKYDLTNILPTLWSKDNPELALETAIRLSNIDQSFFVRRVHTTLTQELQRSKGKENVSKFINALYNKNIASINSVIEPVYLWNRSLSISEDTKANTLLKLFSSKLADTTNYNSKAELAGLLLLKEFEEKKIGDAALKNKLLKKIILNLSSNILVDKVEEKQRKDKEKRAHYRFLLAYSKYLMYEKTDSIVYLENASRYSPDKIDLQTVHAYFYDAHLLINGPNNINYKQKYIRYLKENNKKEDALSLLLEQFYNMPNDKNRNELKEFDTAFNDEKIFERLWFSYLNSKMQDAPKIKIDFKENVLDFNKKRNHWVFVDVWGTWCKPCVDELPKINEAAKMYNEDKKSIVRFYSFSYNSKNLQKFMKDNAYAFPVAEIDHKVTNSFNVSSYPTKILISPENKYLKIPFGANWKNYIKNYTLSH
jgi:thiol-disulfide isomerase/thioredoxin